VSTTVTGLSHQQEQDHRLRGIPPFATSNERELQLSTTPTTTATSTNSTNSTTANSTTASSTTANITTAISTTANSTTANSTTSGEEELMPRAIISIMVPTIVKMILVYAPTNRKLVDITNGMLFDMNKFGNISSPKSITIEVVTSNSGSVRFSFLNKSDYRTDNLIPFMLCGNIGNATFTCPEMRMGQVTVTATPYSGTNRTGSVGVPTTVTFKIERSNPVPAPVPKSPIRPRPQLPPSTNTKPTILVSQPTRSTPPKPPTLPQICKVPSVCSVKSTMQLHHSRTRHVPLCLTDYLVLSFVL
jgi:hypothetical protein